MNSEKLLSTGLPALDIELEGGLFPGSLVYIKADPMAMGDMFLYHFIRQRPTYYVNTERRPEFIIRNLKRLGFETEGIKFIDVHQKYYEKVDKLLDYGREIRDYKILDYLKKQLEAIEVTDVNLIVDTITFFLHLNVKIDMIRELVDTIYNTTKRMEGLGFLYGIKGDTSSLIENEVMSLCDAVFEISMIKQSDKTISELIVPKARDRPVRGNVLKFKIERGVIMDTSKEIA